MTISFYIAIFCLKKRAITITLAITVDYYNILKYNYKR